MEIPFNDQPPSTKFKEDLKRYQARRLETWCNNTVLTKRKIVGTDGKTRVVQVRTVELEDTASRLQRDRSRDTERTARLQRRRRKSFAEIDKELAEPSRKFFKPHFILWNQGQRAYC